MALQSVMQAGHTFSRVPSANIGRSSFNHSHGHKTTFDGGYLVPIYVDEVLPGDTFNLKLSAFARLATPIKPFMDNLFFDTFFFFVPNRLIWTNWERFCGAQDNPDSSTDYAIPQVPAPAATGWVAGTLFDYFGIPTGIPGFSVNNLHGRAYNLIWNDWFRDENLQDSVVVDLGDGPDDPADYVILRRGKRHDYFTSSLPFPQKGPAVALPLGTSAPVTRVPNATPLWTAYNDATNTVAPNGAITVAGGAGGVQGAAGGITFDPNGTLITDLSDATAATINQLRDAAAVQQLYERDARGGTRYTEIVLSHFRVHSPDARLQRPEYLGGGSSRINVNPIAQTSSTDATTPQGNLAAMGTLSAQGHGFVKSFTEHGVIVGLCSVRADLNYQQGLSRMWFRQTRFDYYWPDLANLGEQAVLNKEIMLQATAADELVFGYQERWAEYRYKNSIITGKFRSSDPQTLDYWHLAQDFASLPVLGDTFIQDNPPIARVVAVDTEPEFLLDTFFSLIVARPMPVFSVPGLTRL